MSLRFPPRIACFVCGAHGPADYPLFISPHGTTADGCRLLPHFPFLGELVPPLGLTPPSPDSSASSCRACYNNLLKQWDANEKGGVPLESRVYWTKRLDNLPVLQPEQQIAINAKHIARYPALLNYSKAAYPVSSHHQIQHSTGSSLQHSTGSSLIQSQAKPLWMGCASLPPVSPSPVWRKMGPPSTTTPLLSMSEPQQTHQGLLPTSAGSAPGGTMLVPTSSTNPPSSTPADDNDSALDLSSGSRERENMKSRSSVLSHQSATSHHSSYQSEGAGSSTDILDLTLPDKNATTEICYVCGDEFKKGLLSYVITRPSGGKVPYYPSLVYHPRPPRSRPMDSAGRVQCCDECATFLFKQWEHFEKDSILHSDRNFVLRKRHSQIVDSATFVCYICALDYHSSHLQMIYCRANSENEPYYPQIELSKPPPGASPISGGMVQVCSHCYNCTREKHKGVRSSHTSNPAGGVVQFSSPATTTLMTSSGHHHPNHLQQNPSYEPPLKKRKSSRASVEILNDPDQCLDDDDKNGLSPADIECILCRRKFTVHSFKFLNSQGPPLGGIPYFPFLRTLHRFNDEGGYSHEDDPQGRVRACSMCTTSLINQWTIFQRDALPIDERSYNYLTITGPQSSGRGTPGDTTLLSHAATATPTSGRSLHSPNTPAQLSNNVPPSGSSKYHHPLTSSVTSVIVASVAADSFHRIAPPPLISTDSSGVLRVSGHGHGGGGSGAGSNHAQADLHQVGGGGCGRSSLHANSPRMITGGTTTSATTLQVPPTCPSPGSVNSGASGEPSNHKPSTSSFYCFLCGLHSELSFARNLYSEPQGKKAPYFPFMKDHVPKVKAETLREDGSALVCTFCYHSVMAQWNKFADSRPPVPINARKYNINDYACYVCGVKTYRKRIRALRVMNLTVTLPNTGTGQKQDFPFLRNHRGQKGTVTMENGEMAAVCLDCFLSLKSQFQEAAKYGIPVEKRQYNWMQIPPPPEESATNLVTPKERLDKLTANTAANVAVTANS